MTNNSELSITEATPKAGRREWIGLAVIALPCMLYSMDLTVLNLALPHLSAELKPSSAELLWIVDIYGFMVAGFLITMGTLGDRIGRRKLLLIGACAFGAASILAAYSNSAGMLITTRAILGIAGATLAPSTLSLIRNMFHDPRQRSFAIGIWITAYSVGGAVGPLIGGTLLEHFWWGSVFLIAVPVMVLLLVVGPVLLPEYRDPNPGRPDITSAVISLVAVLAVIFGLKKIAESGLSLLPVASIITGVILGILFLRRQKKVAVPLIDLNLFRAPSFSISLLIYTFTTFVMFGTFIFTFQYLQLILGLTPIKAGLWSLPFFFAFVIGSMLSPMFAARLQPGYVMAIGLLVAAAGFALLTQVSANSGPLFLVTASFIYCLGVAPVFTLTTDIIVSAAPPEKTGAASAISETGSEFGGALGIAILGTIGTAIYRTQMAKNIPAAIPTEIEEPSKETLSGALVQASQLPADLKPVLVSAANEAFISGMRSAMLIAGILVFVLAILCLTRLSPRRTKSS